VWAILIVVQVLDVDHMAYGSGSVYQRCAEQVLQVSTMVPNCVPKHTLIILVCNKFLLFLSNFTNVAYVADQGWIGKYDLLSSSLRKVVCQVFSADTSEKILFFMNIGS
jgi:hypothetical protein